MPRLAFPLIIALATLAFAAESAAAQSPTFTAAFTDGTYITGGKISEWHVTTAQPKLNGRPLMDPAKPVRWLKSDSAEPPSAPKAFVEMFGGDRLPGMVVEHRTGTDATGERQGPCLAVKPETILDGPDQTTREHLRVRLPLVRRIVWQRRARDRYTPGTLYYLDGREAAYRSLRWTSGGVTLLLKEETRKVSFGEIAELHLPRRDPWDVYYETLATLCPDGAGRLMRVETFSGVVATTSMARFQARSISGDSAGWFHMVQPAWSIDPVWIRHPQIQWRRFFAPHEVPLSVLEPQRAEQVSSLGVGWTWQVDRSVRGEPLRTGGKIFGWGLGVPAYCELEFPLPPCAVNFRVRLGLDETVGRGGCARGLVYLNRLSGKPTFESKTLVGSADVEDAGTIDLAAFSKGAKSLILVADPSPADRPPGADPLDIRDMVDWLEPLIELDAEKLQSEIAGRLSRALPAWEGWTVKLGDGVRLAVSNRWDFSEARNMRYRIESVTKGGPLTLARTFQVMPQHNYLSVLAGRFSDGPTPSEIEVRVEGQRIARFPLPERRPGVTVDPQLVPLEKYQGRDVTLEVVCTPKDDKSLVDWRALELVEYTTPTPWVALSPREVTAASKSELTVEPERSIFATSLKVPITESYTVVADTQMQGISAIRLEVLSDPRLPSRGPGRGTDGGFTLTDFRVTAAPLDNLNSVERVELADAAADESDQFYTPSTAIDSNSRSGWGTMRRTGQSHLIVFTTAGDVGFPSGTRLTFTLDQQLYQRVIGRFRLSITNVTRPIPVERPGTILPAEAKP